MASYQGEVIYDGDLSYERSKHKVRVVLRKILSENNPIKYTFTIGNKKFEFFDEDVLFIGKLSDEVKEIKEVLFFLHRQKATQYKTIKTIYIVLYQHKRIELNEEHYSNTTEPPRKDFEKFQHALKATFGSTKHLTETGGNHKKLAVTKHSICLMDRKFRVLEYYFFKNIDRCDFSYTTANVMLIMVHSEKGHAHPIVFTTTHGKGFEDTISERLSNYKSMSAKQDKYKRLERTDSTHTYCKLGNISRSPLNNSNTYPKLMPKIATENDERHIKNFRKSSKRKPRWKPTESHKADGHFTTENELCINRLSDTNGQFDPTPPRVHNESKTTDLLPIPMSKLKSDDNTSWKSTARMSILRSVSVDNPTKTENASINRPSIKGAPAVNEESDEKSCYFSHSLICDEVQNCITETLAKMERMNAELGHVDPTVLNQHTEWYENGFQRRDDDNMYQRLNNGIMFEDDETEDEYDYWHSSDLCMTLQAILENKIPNLHLDFDLAWKQYLNIMINLSLVEGTVCSDWTDLAAHLGLTQEREIEIIRHFCYSFRDWTTNIVLKHWWFQSKRGRDLPPCTFHNLRILIQQLDRQDILRYFDIVDTNCEEA